MKYSREQRLEIGRRIYENELSRRKAAKEYGISEGTAREYMRLYRDENMLPPKHAVRRKSPDSSSATDSAAANILRAMTKERLVQELIKSKFTEIRLRKKK